MNLPSYAATARALSPAKHRHYLGIEMSKCGIHHPAAAGDQQGKVRRNHRTRRDSVGEAGALGVERRQDVERAGLQTAGSSAIATQTRLCWYR